MKDLCCMKKILEVLQDGDIDIRFNTDLDPVKHPNVIPNVITRTAFAMVTKLWGGNEAAVLAMIRALAIADLAVSVNRQKPKAAGKERLIPSTICDSAYLEQAFENDQAFFLKIIGAQNPAEMKTKKDSSASIHSPNDENDGAPTRPYFRAKSRQDSRSPAKSPSGSHLNG